MKKKIAFVLVLYLILMLAACGIASEKAQPKSLYNHGLDIISMLTEMTHSENLLNIYTANSEITSILLALGEKDYGNPQAVYALTVPEETLNRMAELESLEGASEGLQSFLKQRVMASLISQLNAMGGVERLAATSVCTAGKTFVSENATENVIYIYAYEDAAPVAVTFTLGEDHTVSASGTFILYDGFQCGSAEEIQSVFSDIAVTVREVTPEK